MHGDNQPREMVKGNWTCGTCGGNISELPFTPSPDRLASLKCRDCHKKSQGDRGDRGERRNFSGRNSGPREMFKGDWTCGNCGQSITELPFKPDPDRVSSLKCRDCFAK